MHSNLTNFFDILLDRAENQADSIAYVFHDELGQGTRTLTYSQLLMKAGALAAQLPPVRNERVLLVLRANERFVIAFFACLLAGAVPVPTAVPRRDHLAGRLQGLLADAQPALGITDHPDVAASCAGLPWRNIGDADFGVDESAPPLRGLVRPAPDALAFLQYTSGSTGHPKGVMVTHDNIVANSRTIAAAFEHDASSRGLVALPLFHDMGLIGGVLQPLFAGFPMTIMNPALPIQKPDLWLSMISSDRISTSGGPNFLFDWVARSVKDEALAGLDLSCWRKAFCGAEPIRRATVQSFIKRLAGVGFRPTAFFPCYGMAEATLYVAGGHNNADETTGPVSCGRAGLDTDVRIVDPATCRELEDGAEGEIWVHGPGVAAGYWQRKESSAEVFGAAIAGLPGRTYLRTGDLGFLRQGSLYVSGRMKDLIIVRGRNLAPEDLELEAEGSHADLQAAASAAFSVIYPDREALVIVAEVKRQALHRPEDLPAVRECVRAAVSASHQVKVDDVVLLRPGTLPRTSSGKVRRSQCRADYLAQAFPPLERTRLSTS